MTFVSYFDTKDFVCVQFIFVCLKSIMGQPIYINMWSSMTDLCCLDFMRQRMSLVLVTPFFVLFGGRGS